jgi:hypothetical protein
MRAAPRGRRATRLSRPAYTTLAVASAAKVRERYAARRARDTPPLVPALHHAAQAPRASHPFSAGGRAARPRRRAQHTPTAAPRSAQLNEGRSKIARGVLRAAGHPRGEAPASPTPNNPRRRRAAHFTLQFLHLEQTVLDGEVVRRVQENPPWLPVRPLPRSWCTSRTPHANGGVSRALRCREGEGRHASPYCAAHHHAD